LNLRRWGELEESSTRFQYHENCSRDALRPWDGPTRARDGRDHRVSPHRSLDDAGLEAFLREDRASCKAGCAGESLRCVGDGRRACRGVRGVAPDAVRGDDRATGRPGQ